MLLWGEVRRGKGRGGVSKRGEGGVRGGVAKGMGRARRGQGGGKEEVG